MATTGDGHSSPGTGDADHGLEMVERVIAAVSAQPSRLVLDYAPRAGTWLQGPPSPVPADVLATLRFPSGRPLPPSLRRWLAFDTSLLTRFGWFQPNGGHRLTPRPLGEIAAAEYGEPWATLYQPVSARFTECFLLPGGSDSRRIYVVDEPDEAGEYPVFAVDVDDLPCIVLMYPGFDVYLADTAGVITVPLGGYSTLAADPTYGRRMHTHARHAFGGQLAATLPRPAVRRQRARLTTASALDDQGTAHKNL